MKKFTIAFGIIMTIIWSAVSVYFLKSWAGIGVGLCFGISFTIMVKRMSKKNGTSLDLSSVEPEAEELSEAKELETKEPEA